MYFESDTFTSGLTEKFCILCGYGIEHTEADHADLVNFRVDAEFLETLKHDDLIWTPYGCARAVRNIYFKGALQYPQLNLSCITEPHYLMGVLIGGDVTVEYSTPEYKCREIYLYTTAFPSRINSTLLKQFSPLERDFLMFKVRGKRVSEVLQNYSIKPVSAKEVAKQIEEEIEEEIELERHQNVLLDWVSSI